MSDQFVEIFPIEPTAAPILAAYTVVADEGVDEVETARIGARFCAPSQ